MADHVIKVVEESALPKCTLYIDGKTEWVGDRKETAIDWFKQTYLTNKYKLKHVHTQETYLLKEE